jgi:hypothetical protein
MKRLLIGFIVTLLVASAAWAQVWHTTNQATVKWDPVTELSDGTPLPAGDVIKYDIYMVNAVTDPGKANPVKVAENIEATQHTLTLGVEGRFLLGITAKRVVDNEVVAESEVGWTDDPEIVADGIIWGLRHFLGLPKPTWQAVE